MTISLVAVTSTALLLLLFFLPSSSSVATSTSSSIDLPCMLSSTARVSAKSTHSPNSCLSPADSLYLHLHSLSISILDTEALDELMRLCRKSLFNLAITLTKKPSILTSLGPPALPQHGHVHFRVALCSSKNESASNAHAWLQFSNLAGVSIMHMRIGHRTEIIAVSGPMMSSSSSSGIVNPRDFFMLFTQYSNSFGGGIKALTSFSGRSRTNKTHKAKCRASTPMMRKVFCPARKFTPLAFEITAGRSLVDFVTF